MTQEHLRRYDEICLKHMPNLQKLLEAQGIKTNVEYSQSYEAYMKASEWNIPTIRIKEFKAQNTGIDIMLYFNDENYYFLSLWIYKNGEHKFFKKDYKHLLTDSDLLDMVKEVKKFFGYSIVEEKKKIIKEKVLTQMSIFDFIS